MKKPTRARQGDFSQIARAIVEEATGESLTPKKKAATGTKKTAKAAAKKNPAAVELGRKGGLVGGKRRLETMTPEQRSEVARKAAQARWSKDKKK
ncbi:MAG: histone H1 [Bacteroidetes bacterium]|nr:histone H1 [Bacteroidota bacterium]